MTISNAVSMGPQFKNEPLADNRLKRHDSHAYQSLNSRPEYFKIKGKNAVVANNFKGMAIGLIAPSGKSGSELIVETGPLTANPGAWAFPAPVAAGGSPLPVW